MAVDSNAQTLADYYLMANDPLVRSVTMSLIESGSVMQDIPFVMKKSLTVKGTRFTGNLPSVSWGGLNSQPTVTKGQPTPWAEQAYILRNAIDTDKYLVMEENAISDPRGLQLQFYLKAQTFDMNDKFINNDHVGGDSNAPVGLLYRLNNPTTFGARSGAKIDAGAAVITTAATVAQANAFFEWLDSLLWYVDSPNGDQVVLYMNEQMKRRVAFLARLMGPQGGFRIDQDQLGRTVEMYKGATLRDIGYKGDQSSRIISSTEASDGTSGSSNYTSIYAVNYGAGHFGGWQYEPLAAHDLGLLNDGTIYRTVIDWAGGIYNDSDRSIGRLFGLKYS